MANMWSKLIATSAQKKLVNQAIAQGDLHAAAELICKHKYNETMTGRRTAKRLASELLKAASTHRAQDDLPQAWTDLDKAGDVAPDSFQDQIAREKTELLELTIENADRMLVEGKVAHAVKVIEEVRKRKIRDWRSERIDTTARKIRSADEASANGRWAEALADLKQARELRPDLTFLVAKNATFEHQAGRFNEMKKQLESALLDGQWTRVSTVCKKLLLISPNYSFAIDAQRQWSQRNKKDTAVGDGQTDYSPRLSKDGKLDERLITPPLNSYPVGVHSSTYMIKEENTEPKKDSIDNHDPSHDSSQRFMIWVDGVGGYMVCPAPCNIVGQAVNQAMVQIPMQGDLQQKHIRFESVDGCHLLQPLAKVKIDEQDASESVQLKNGQIISLDSNVQLIYVQPHPLSKTARLDFQSRHRTSPWSDGILLASHPIILGPGKRNHVVCPKWANDLVIFRQGDQWKAKSSGSFTVDSVPQTGVAEISLTSRIEGDDFALSLEPL